MEKICESTEEGKKVTRNKGQKFVAIFRRIADDASSDLHRISEPDADLH